MPTILQDFVTAARMLEVAGLGFGEDETYKIQLSIKQLAVHTNIYIYFRLKLKQKN